MKNQHSFSKDAVSRRRFLGQTAAAAVGFSIVPRRVLGGAGYVPPSDKVNIAFIGVDGLTPQEGCTTHDEMEAQTDLAFLRRARRSIVIADSSKIGRVTFARICTVSDVDNIITDRAVTDEQMRSLSSAGAQVTTV